MAAEIISTVERRRRWSAEDKLRIMSQALEPDAVVAAVADRNGVCRSLLYTWLRMARGDRLLGLSMAPRRSAQADATTFVPVRIERPVRPEANVPASTPQPRRDRSRAQQRRSAIVEIMLANGRSLKVDESIDPAALARLLAVLDGEMRLRQHGDRA